MKPVDPQFYIDGVLAGDRRMLSKAITLIESALTTHQEAARLMLSALLPKTGAAVRLGITGVPFFVFERTYGVSGAQPADILLQVLEKVAAETSGSGAGAATG